MLTESFCSDTIPSSYYEIPGYNLHRKDREGRIGGGILVYRNECLSVERCTDLETDDIEILWLKVCPHRSNRSLLISGVYRPPATCKAATSTALIRHIDQILFDLDKDNVSGLIFIDYSKAFDLVDHRILIKKLTAYGLCGNEVKLFDSYLSGRSQYVIVDGFKSTVRNVSLGVPQGSVLGPWT